MSGGMRKEKRYAAKVLRAARRAGIKPGQVMVVDVRHDDWCALLRGRGECNCTPDVSVGDGTPVAGPEDS